jgi:hypothetical protein
MRYGPFECRTLAILNTKGRPMIRYFGFLMPFAVALAVLGCGEEQARQSTPPPNVESGAQDLLAAEPEGAQDVIDVRENAQDEEAVVVVGRIGGSKNPWVEGRAAFSIVDVSLQACSDKTGDRCPTPWDYCCETDRLPKATVLVKVVDDSGALLDTDARELLQVKELQAVVVEGTAQRDDSGNLTVLTEGVYLKP